MSLILARWYAIPCGLCVPRAWSGCPSGFPRVPFACVCARALAASAPPPPPRVGVARAPRAVSVLGAGRAVPRSPCPSLCPASVPCSVWLAFRGGGGPVPVPPTWLGAARSPWGGCGRGDPTPTPPRTLLRAGFARCGGGTRVPRGGACCLGLWPPGSGALPSPTTLPVGRAAGAHYPLAVGAGAAGVGTCHLPHSPRYCALALRAVGAARGRPGGGASCLGEGRPGSGAFLPPTTSPPGRAAGAHYPLAAGAAGAGTRHQPNSARSCELALRAVGAAGERPWGGASCLGVGPPGSGAFLPPTTSPLGRAAGAHYPLAVGAGAAGVGTCHQPHSARSCELALRAVGAARGHPRGAHFAWVWGVRGRALSYP